MDFFIKSADGELEKLAQGATHMDDIDLLVSPKDGALVPVATKLGQRVCWQCGKHFREDIPALRGVEVKHGYVRIMLHAGCEDPESRPRIFQNPMQLFDGNLRGMQFRRQLASAAHASQSVADAAESMSLADRIRSKKL